MDFNRQAQDIKEGGMPKAYATLQAQRQKLEQKEHLVKMLCWVEEMEELRLNGFFSDAHHMVFKREFDHDYSNVNGSLVKVSVFGCDGQPITQEQDFEMNDKLSDLSHEYGSISHSFLEYEFSGKVVVNDQFSHNMLSLLLLPEFKAAWSHACMTQQLDAKETPRSPPKVKL